MTAYAMTSPVGGGVTVRRVVSVRPVPTAVGRVRRLGLLLVLATAALVGFFAPGAFAGSDAAGSAESGTVAFDTYTVAPGESLWSIASALTGPDEDVRDTVAQLQTLNTMSDSSLRAGEQIFIPALERASR